MVSPPVAVAQLIGFLIMVLAGVFAAYGQIPPYIAVLFVLTGIALALR